MAHQATARSSSKYVHIIRRHKLSVSVDEPTALAGGGSHILQPGLKCLQSNRKQHRHNSRSNNNPPQAYRQQREPVRSPRVQDGNNNNNNRTNNNDKNGTQPPKQRSPSPQPQHRVQNRW